MAPGTTVAPGWWHQAWRRPSSSGISTLGAHISLVVPPNHFKLCSLLFFTLDCKPEAITSLRASKVVSTTTSQCNSGVDVHRSWSVTTDRCQYFPPPISCSKIFSRWRSSTLTQFFSSLHYIFFDVVTQKPVSTAKTEQLQCIWKIHIKVDCRSLFTRSHEGKILLFHTEGSPNLVSH